MDKLTTDIIGIILRMLNPDLRTLLRYKKVCKHFWKALNSPKLAYLYHYKYYTWYQSAKRGPAKHLLHQKDVPNSARDRGEITNDIRIYWEYYDGVVDGPPRGGFIGSRVYVDPKSRKCYRIWC